jgi:4-amino-4-deoxy-L-arabinose transferase-like glycosyltransferase
VARDLWNIAGYSLLFALFPWAAFRLGMTRMPGWIAGGVAATYTLYGPSEISWGRDEWLAALGLMLLTVFAWRLAQREELPARSLLGFGAGWGGLMYVQPATLLVLPLHLGIVLWARRRPIAVRVNRAGLFFAAFLLAVAPWTVRNRMAMGSWFFMRDNAGLEMEASNGDGALAAFEANVNGPWFCSVHPDCFEGASVEIREVGEVEFNRRAMRKAVVWIEENPGYFAALSARRAMYFWFDLPARGMRFYIRGAMALLGLAGLWLMWRRGLRVQAALFAAVWAAYPLTFYVVQYMDRYASPIAAAVLLPAGFAIEALAGRRVTTPDRVGSG